MVSYINTLQNNSPSQIELRKKLAEQMLASASSQQVQSPLQAIGRFAREATAKRDLESAARDEQALQQARREQLLNAMTGGDPSKAASLEMLPTGSLEQLLMNRYKPSEPITLKQGETVYDPATGQPIYTAPMQQKPQAPVSVRPGQTLVDPMTGEPIYTAPAAEPKLPAGYRMSETGEAEPIPGTLQAVQMQEAQSKQQKGNMLKTEALRLVDELLADKDAIYSAAGPFDAMTPTFFSDAKDAEIKLDTLANILTAENLDMMKGILSDTDIKILRSIQAGGLRLDRGDKQLIAELERMQKALQNAQQTQSGQATQGGAMEDPLGIR